MAPDKGGRSVFIGNIPYDLSEEQIKDMLSAIGHVEKFRLLTNPENGKPKGYGFATFSDPDAAASAVRNLDSTEIMGRKIRVDFSHDNKDDDNAPASYDSRSMPANGANPSGTTPLPPLPPGVELAPGLTCPDSISRTLNTLPASQLLDVLSQMKGLVMGDPGRATELLRQAPQLAYAVFQALLLMDLVDTSVLGSVVEQASQQTVLPPTAQPGPPQYMQQPPTHPPFPQMPVQQQTATPPVQQYGQMPAPAQPAQVPPAQPSQEELLKQVMAMPQSQIDALPPAERAQIMALRQALLGQQF